MNRIKFFVFFILLFAANCGVTQAQQTAEIYIVEGVVADGENGWMPYYTFNSRNSFDSSNVILRFASGVQVDFNVTNTTSITCGFKINGYGETGNIPAGETRSLSLILEAEGTFLYEDPLNDQRALGLGGMLVVSDFTGPTFYGVLTEHDNEWTKTLTQGGVYSKKSYKPETYTVNGRGFPDVKRDSLISIHGHVGDTIHIHLTNAGQMHHFPHFHGFHVKILEATKQPELVGRLKDSFGLLSGESMTLELVPDKPGRYPIHNHNLITTTFGGNYPGGMMIHMHIYE